MLLTLRPTQLPVERFEADLQEICGAFSVRPEPDRKSVRGNVTLLSSAGIEMAHVAADLQQVVRSRRQVRRDQSETYFLILQEEGKALMSQNEQSHLLHPGDMVLVDSASPSDFTFFGSYNRQLSLHLPRAELHERFGERIVRGGTALSRHDPTSLAICAVLSKVLGEEQPTPGATLYLREAILGLLGAMLYERSQREGYAGMDVDFSGATALAAGQAYVDSHYRNPDLTIQSMAEDLGLSARQLQRAFCSIGSTPTKYILVKRLEHARRGLGDRRAGRWSDLVLLDRLRGRLFGPVVFPALFSAGLRKDAACLCDGRLRRFYRKFSACG